MNLKVILGILIIAVGGYFLYNHFFKKEELVEVLQVVQKEKSNLELGAKYKLYKEVQKRMRKTKWSANNPGNVKKYQELLNFIQQSNLEKNIAQNIYRYIYLAGRWLNNDDLAEQCQNLISGFDAFIRTVKEPCPMCNDQGEYICTVCGGTNVCGACGGRGYIQRGDLVKEGKYKKLESRRDDCPPNCQYCNGGKIQCKKCPEYANYITKNTLLQKIPEYYNLVDKALSQEIKHLAILIKNQ